MIHKRVFYTLLTTLCACSELPPIEAGQCGNGVVEASNGEECDSLASDGLVCRPPTASTGACRYDCTTTACPTGFGCGLDGLCRAASASYTTLGRGSSPVELVRLADMDGDGRADVVAKSPQGVTVTYANDPFTGLEVAQLSLERGRFTTGKLQSARVSSGGTKTTAASTLVILDTDIANIAATQGASGGALSIYRGSATRSLLPTLYPSIPVNADGVRLAAGQMSQRVGQLGVGQDALVFTDVSAKPGDARGVRGGGYSLGHFAPAENGSSTNSPLAELPEMYPYVDALPTEGDRIADRIGLPTASGPLVKGYKPAGFPASVPYLCDTVAWSNLPTVADPGGAVWLLPLCHLDASVFDPTKPAQTLSYLPNYIPSLQSTVGPVRRAKLVPPTGAVITGGVTLRDVPRLIAATETTPAHYETDGLLDVLVPSATGLLIAYGDGTWTISDPAPTSPTDDHREFPLVALEGVQGTSAPLAFGDFNGDGDLDWVDATAVHFNATRQPLLARLSRPLSQVGTVARSVDLDGDGVDDLVVGGEGGFTVYRGIKDATVYPSLNKLEYPLDGSVTQLNIGDFDGDGRPDISYIARTGSADTAGVAYGASGFPLTPTTLGSLAQLDQLLTIQFSWLLSGTPDSIDSILAFGKTRHVRADGTTEMLPAGITLQGKANREMNARFGLNTQDRPLRRGIALGAASGRFAGEQDGLMMLASSVEVLSRDDAPKEATFRIWYAPSSGDAQLDIATVQSSPALRSVPYTADGAAVVGATPQFAAAGIDAGDLDGDGFDEGIIALPQSADQPARLLVARPGETSGDGTLRFVESTVDGSGALSALSTDPAQKDELRIRVGDFDGDGHRDVLVVRLQNRGTTTQLMAATIYYGDGTLQLTQARSFTLPALDLVDVTAIGAGAGKSPLVGLTATGVMPVVLDRAAATASLDTSRTYLHGASGVHGLATGDVDGDGVIDLAISSETGFVIARGAPVLQ